jgi:imidazolonepropionase-like amidohydrolase
MGLEERFGSIQTGKVADLAIVDGDPLWVIQIMLLKRRTVTSWLSNGWNVRFVAPTLRM